MARSYDQPAPSAAAALLQLARIKAGLTQCELAERAGVPTTMISAYERDKRQPTLATLLRLLRAAGFELRMQLEPYEAHDDVLADLDAARSDKERARRDRQIEAWRRAVPARPARQGFEGGYKELSARAHVVEVDDVEVRIADLADVIRSKEAAGRPKDLRVLPALYRHLAAQREPRRESL